MHQIPLHWRPWLSEQSLNPPKPTSKKGSIINIDLIEFDLNWKQNSSDINGWRHTNNKMSLFNQMQKNVFINNNNFISSSFHTLSNATFHRISFSSSSMFENSKMKTFEIHVPAPYVLHIWNVISLDCSRCIFVTTDQHFQLVIPHLHLPCVFRFEQVASPKRCMLFIDNILICKSQFHCQFFLKN